MSVTLGSFLPDLLMGLPGCTDILAERAVLLAATRLAREASVVQQDLAAISVVAGTAVYSVATATGGATTCEVISVTLDDVGLAPLGFSSIDASRVGDPISTTVAGVPVGYLQYSDQSIVLRPTPTAAGTLNVRVAIAPTDSATTIDDMFSTRHREAVLSGALYRLHSIPQQPFTDASLVAYHKGMFETYVARERGLATLGMARSPLRVTAVY